MHKLAQISEEAFTVICFVFWCPWLCENSGTGSHPVQTSMYKCFALGVLTWSSESITKNEVYVLEIFFVYLLAELTIENCWHLLRKEGKKLDQKNKLDISSNMVNSGQRETVGCLEYYNQLSSNFANTAHFPDNVTLYVFLHLTLKVFVFSNVK